MSELDRKLLRFQREMAGRGQIKKLFVKEDKFKDEREKLQTMSQDIRISKKGREAVKRHMDKFHDQLNRKDLVVDEKRSKEYDKMVDYNMRKAIRTGNIPKYDPRKDSQGNKFAKKALGK